MKLLKIDEQGYFVEDVIVKETPKIAQEDEEGNTIFLHDPQYIQIPCENGMYKPKWVGDKWIEGMKEEEIQSIKNTPKPKTELEKMQEIVDMLLLDSLGV